MLESDTPQRTADIRRDPRFRGWWPATHPSTSSFLGVPILSAGGGVAGAFHLTDKEGAPEFSDDDQRLIETFAAHAALALENARLHERSRELSIVGAVERGEALLDPAVAARVLQEIVSPDGAPARAQRHESLTAREREVLALLARGRANKAIAPGRGR